MWELAKIVIILIIINKLYAYNIVAPWKRGEKVAGRCVLFLLAQLVIIFTFMVLREYKFIFE